MTNHRDHKRRKYPSYKKHRKEYNKNVYYATRGKYERRPWDDLEEHIIMFSEKPDRELSDLLERSVSAIQIRRNHIKQEGRPWLKNKTPVMKTTPANLEKQEEEAWYDNRNGYEKFYQTVFNSKYVSKEDSFNRKTLPDDYKETVLYVINNSGFKKKYIYILMHFFGIGDCNKPEIYKIIGNHFGVTANAVCQMKNRAIGLCRLSPTKDILQMGITKYTEEQSRAKISEKLL